MLRRLSEQTQRAQAYAAHAAEQAKKAASPRDQREWLAIERSWLKLVDGYELSERIQTYLAAYGPKKK
jgi:hypothetical protein